MIFIYELAIGPSPHLAPTTIRQADNACLQQSTGKSRHQYS